MPSQQSILNAPGIVPGTPTTINGPLVGNGSFIEQGTSGSGGGISAVQNTDSTINASTASGVVTLSVAPLVVALAGVPQNVNTSNITYNNGTNGVGATLTANIAGSLSVDSVVPTSGSRVLINGYTGIYQKWNGVYTVTNNGSVTGAHWQLTRATDFNSSANIFVGKAYSVTGGATYTNTVWSVSSFAGTVGTSAIVFTWNSVSNNDTKTQTLEVGGYAQIGSNLTVNGGSYIYGNCLVEGTHTVDNYLTVGNYAQIGTSLGVGQSINFGASLASNDNNFRYDPVTQALSVGRGDTMHNATGEFIAQKNLSITPPNSCEAYLEQMQVAPIPYGASALQVAPVLGNPSPSGCSMTQVNDPSGPYLANGTTWVANIWTFDGNSVCSFPTTISFTDDNSNRQFDIQFAIAEPATSTNTPTDYFIQLPNLDGGVWDTGLSGEGSYIILDSAGATNYSATLPASLYNDYLANSTYRGYQAYGWLFDPAREQYFSSGSYAYSMTDDGSRNLYQVYHSINGSNFSRVLGDPAGGTAYDQAFDLTGESVLYENGASWTGSTSVSPSNPTGFLANGATLNISYAFYNLASIGGANHYSVDGGGGTVSVNDPNDSNYYWVYLRALSGSSPYKIVRSGNQSGAILLTGDNQTDYPAESWTESTTITPTGYMLPGLIAASESTSIDDVPGLIVKSLSSTIPVTNFQDNSGNVVGKLAVEGGALVYKGGSGTTTTLAPA